MLVLDKFRKVLKLVKTIVLGKNLGEHDLVLKLFSRLTDKKPCDRIMIDVGAHHGFSMLKFAKLDWKVYCFEPDDDNRITLLKNIQTHKLNNVFVDERAVSNLETSAKYYKSEISSGISSLIKFHPSHQEAIEVKITTLSVFCNKNNINSIDFLKIDTEGNDLKVIEGLEMNLFKPSVILCEYEDSKTKLVNYSKEDIINFLVTNGYKYIISEWYPIIQYGTQHKWKKITDEISFVDNNSWGNIIATKPELYEQVIRIIKKTYKKRDLNLIHL